MSSANYSQDFSDEDYPHDEEYPRDADDSNDQNPEVEQDSGVISKWQIFYLKKESLKSTL